MQLKFIFYYLNTIIITFVLTLYQLIFKYSVFKFCSQKINYVYQLLNVSSFLHSIAELKAVFYRVNGWLGTLQGLERYCDGVWSNEEYISGYTVDRHQEHYIQGLERYCYGVLSNEEYIVCSVVIPLCIDILSGCLQKSHIVLLSKL